MIVFHGLDLSSSPYQHVHESYPTSKNYLCRSTAHSPQPNCHQACWGSISSTTRLFYQNRFCHPLRRQSSSWAIWSFGFGPTFTSRPCSWQRTNFYLPSSYRTSINLLTHTNLYGWCNFKRSSTQNVGHHAHNATLSIADCTGEFTWTIVLCRNFIA